MLSDHTHTIAGASNQQGNAPPTVTLYDRERETTRLTIRRCEDSSAQGWPHALPSGNEDVHISTLPEVETLREGIDVPCSRREATPRMILARGCDGQRREIQALSHALWPVEDLSLAGSTLPGQSFGLLRPQGAPSLFPGPVEDAHRPLAGLDTETERLHELADVFPHLLV